jgi:hypothetical protein
LHSLFSIFKCLVVQICIIRRNLIKQTKFNSYSKHFDNCAKIEHVGLYTIGAHNKKLEEKRKKQIYFIEWQGKSVYQDKEVMTLGIFNGRQL